MLGNPFLLNRRLYYCVGGKHSSCHVMRLCALRADGNQTPVNFSDNCMNIVPLKLKSVKKYYTINILRIHSTLS